MKIGKWTRKLSAALVAGGLLCPSAASAAPLGTNLLENPGFEIVGTAGGIGAYLDDANSSWMDGSTTDYAYAHSTGYANGTLANPGTYFFSSQFASGSTNDGSDVLNPGEVAQSVDVSTGESAALIASGNAKFSLSGFFSSYRDDGDFATMQLDFLDGGGGALGAPILITDSDTTQWSFESASGSIPVGTASMLVSLFGEALTGNADGYIDNVSLSVVPEPTSVVLAGLGITGLALGGLRRRNQG